jgi:anaerobic magnesium-protoporphyrin IX monomethyl ester cyclase
MTGSQRDYFELNRRLRDELIPRRAVAGQKPVFSAFGGPHPTFFPDMITEPGVDGICVGEGEGAMLDLADALARRNGTYDTNLPNWWFNVEGEVVKNLPRPLIHDLSALPHPDRALVYDKYPDLAASQIKHFISSRGCPYACTYCFNHAYYQIYKGERRGQQRSVDDVIAEVKAVRARWPLEQAVFIDDLFVIYNDWLEEFAEKWPREVGLPFFANVRANLLVKDPYKVELLKKAGCGTVSMGIEAANDRIRVELLKRRMTRQDMIEAGRMVRAAGIHITATNILGLPDQHAGGRPGHDAAERRGAHQLRVRVPVPALPRHRTRPVHQSSASCMAARWMTSARWRGITPDPGLRERRGPPRARASAAALCASASSGPAGGLIRRLIRLPHNKVVDNLFWWIHKLHKGYAIYHRVHPIKRRARWNCLRRAAFPEDQELIEAPIELD